MKVRVNPLTSHLLIVLKFQVHQEVVETQDRFFEETGRPQGFAGVQDHIHGRGQDRVAGQGQDHLQDQEHHDVVIIKNEGTGVVAAVQGAVHPDLFHHLQLVS